MPECTPEQFAAATKGVVVAAAGCGKTELIVRAIASSPNKRDLVLTHTHAGVRALTDRLRGGAIARNRAPVDTIAGWCLRLAANYPKLSGIQHLEPKSGEWADVYDSAVRVLQVPAVRVMLRNSYSGIYVDEYQDCSKPQHAVVIALAKMLPCRVVGDPLQSIFDFGVEMLVSWNDDVFTFFDVLPELSTPHRWRDAPALGEWVTYLRSQILAGASIDLPAAAVTRVDPHPAAVRKQLEDMRRALSEQRSLAVITGFPAQAHRFARDHRGFQSLEPVDCPDLFEWAVALDQGDGRSKARRLLEIGQRCFTGLSNLKKDIARLDKGLPIKPGKGELATLRLAVRTLSESGTSADLASAIKSFNTCEQQKVRLYRHEAWKELGKAVESLQTGQHPDLRSAAWARRQRLRSEGRKPPRSCIGRPVLVKGLEFTDAAVLDIGQYGRENLYVALTRASKRLVLASADGAISPKPA